MCAANLDHHFDPVPLWHEQIRYNDIIITKTDKLKSSLAIMDGCNLKTAI